MDIRQSFLYAEFLKKLGWQIKKIGKWNVFVRSIPLFGKIAKLQKIKKPIPFAEIEDFIHDEKIRTIVIEPDEQEDNILTAQFLINGYKINQSPFLPTKTIQIDLTPSETEIFKSFTEAKRRAIRKAIKNNVSVKESTDIESFINLKIGYFPLFGFLLKKEYRKLWQVFYSNYLASASLLLAALPVNNNDKHTKHPLSTHSTSKYSTYCNSNTIHDRYNDLDHQSKTLAGILLLFYKHQVYYWLAASSKKGNKLFAPSLLVWEALKLAKKRGCTIFDFEGIYDPRFHKATKKWQGFTRFKKGFGGKEVTYLKSFYK